MSVAGSHLQWDSRYISITGMSYCWVIATRSRTSLGRAVSDRLAPQMQLTVTEQSDGPLVQPTL